jgi:hypothetical protein
MVLEIAQTAEFSRALDTALPVEISFCVFAMFVLIERSVCSATMAELLVRIEDMFFPWSGALMRRETATSRVATLPFWTCPAPSWARTPPVAVPVDGDANSLRRF